MKHKIKNILNWFKKDADTIYVQQLITNQINLTNRPATLEEFIGVVYFAGPKNKPHYRKKKMSK